MTMAERVFQEIRNLPEAKQAQVLDFAKGLQDKAPRDEDPLERSEWATFALVQAMRGMEDEDWPYSLSDLKEVF